MEQDGPIRWREFAFDDDELFYKALKYATEVIERQNSITDILVK